VRKKVVLTEAETDNAGKRPDARCLLFGKDGETKRFYLESSLAEMVMEMSREFSWRIEKRATAIEESGRAILALIDLTNQRVSALCDHLGVTTDIVPAKPAHYEVFAAKKSDDKTEAKGEKDATA
jgi:hypothetical protein